MTGEMFGPYRLDLLLGRGGMGEVYRAFDTVKQRTVALKRLPTSLAGEPEFRTRFGKEAALAARLNEPHIIPIHDYGEINGRLFIDMRLVEGTDLAVELATNGPFSATRAVNVVGQVAAALDAAHAQGLAHRDIKPANILLAAPSATNSRGGDGEFVYVADFGIARSTSSTTLTATGATIGTLDYIAPERFLTGHGDHRVDIYALGCVFFEILTGCRPFPGEGLLALMYAHVNTPPPAPSLHRPELPVAVDAVVARAMAKDPDQRYATAGALAEAARDALIAAAGMTIHGTASAGTPVGRVAAPTAIPVPGTEVPHPLGLTHVVPQPITSPDLVRRRRSYSLPLAAGAVVLVVVAVAGIGLFTAGRGSQPEANPGGPMSTPTTSNHAQPHTGVPRLAGSIALPDDPSSLAFSPDGRYAYVTLGSGLMSVVDMTTNTVAATIGVGAGALGVAITPDGRYAYVSHWGPSPVTVIDTASRTVAATMDVGAVQWKPR